MASILRWLGNAAHTVEHAVGINNQPVAQRAPQARPQQMQQVGPQIGPVQQVQQPRLVQAAPRPMTIAPQVTVARPQALQMGNQTFAPNPRLRTAPVPQPVPQMSAHEVMNAGLHSVGNGLNRIDQHATQSALGRAAQTVGLGALRSGIGTGQAVSGLYDLASKGTGTNRVSKTLNKLAKQTDATAKENHANGLLYHGSQAATDLLQFAIGGGEAKAAGTAIAKVPRVATALKTVAKVSPNIESKVAAKTASMAEKGIAKRTAARAINNAAKPSYQAGNAAFTALQVGKDASQGKQITPVGVAENLIPGAVGFPVAGAAAHEVGAPAVRLVGKGARALDTHLRENPIPVGLGTKKVTDKLPDNPDAYFNIDKNTKMVPVKDLVRTHGDAEHPGGSASAENYMRQALNGQTDKRAPLLVHEGQNGKYNVLDGNSTTAAAQKHGFKQVPVHVVKTTDIPHPDHVNNVKALIQQAHEANPTFQEHAQSIAAAHGLDHLPGPVKGTARTLEKTINKYAGDHTRVGDTVRATIPLTDHSPSSIQQIIDHVQANHNVHKIKNPKHLPDVNGYADTKAIITLPNGHKGEIIMASPEMLAAKKNGGHDLYKISRDLTKTPAERAAAGEEMRQLYAEAQASANKRLASSGVLPKDSNTLTAASSDAGRAPSMSPPTSLETPVKTIVSRDKPEAKGRTLSTTSSSVINSRDSAITDSTIADGRDVVNNLSTPKVVENRFSKGGRLGKQNISPELQQEVSGEHVQRNTAAMGEQASQDVNKLPLLDAINAAHDKLAVAPGSASDADHAFVIRAIERTDEAAARAKTAGNDAAFQQLNRDSAALHDGLSEHLTAKGQGAQIAALLYSRTPQGLFYSAMRDLKKAGVNVEDPELRNRLQTLTDNVKNAANPDEKSLAIAKFHQAVSKEMPQGVGDKLMGIWKAGLLSGVKTQQGNAISNAMFAFLKKVSDPLSATVDRAISLGTGERTIGVTQKGSLSGTFEGSKNGLSTMKTGLDKRNVGDKYEQHAEINFKNKVIDKTLGGATRFVFRGMNAADQPFWYSAFKNSMYDQAKAEGATQGLKGKELAAFMEQRVKDPTPKMANTALREANKSTLNYDTIGSKAISMAHKGIDMTPGITPAGKSLAHGVLNVLAPFVRVPTAFLSRTVDFTPLGIGKEAFHQYFGKEFDQRALSKAIGEGITGTGVIAAGIYLTQRNLISGDYPKTDQKEQQRWKAEGITPNSVKIGNKWISLNYMGPVGLLFNAGNKMANSDSPNALSKVAVGIGGLGQGLMGQSFLQGFSGFSDAINDPNRNMQKFANSQVASIVPNIVNDVANVTDKYQRQADNTGQAIMNKLPIAREHNNIKQDVYGNDLKQPGGQLGTLIGVKPSNDLSHKNAVVGEVDRLHNLDAKNKDLQVTPTPVNQKLTIDGQKVTLSNQQTYELQHQVGQYTQQKWNDLIKTPEYKRMSDADKAAALDDIRKQASDLAQRDYVVKNNLGTYSKGVSAREQNLANSGVTSALKQTGKGSVLGQKPDFASSNDAEYKYLQAKYNDDKKNNRLSLAQDIRAQDTLNRAKVGASYDKNVRDFYGLTKSQFVQATANNPSARQAVIDYGDALVKAGVISKNKFRNSKGALSLTTTTRGGGTGNRKSGTGRAKRPAIPKIAHMKTPHLKPLKQPHFKTASVKAPSFKRSRAKLPSYATKTPRVTSKALA